MLHRRYKDFILFAFENIKICKMTCLSLCKLVFDISFCKFHTINEKRLMIIIIECS